MASDSNADNDIKRMMSVDLKLVSYSKGNEEVYTMLAIEGSVLMTIVCKVTEKFHIKAYDAGRAEVFTAESDKYFGSRTQVTHANSFCGVIYTGRTRFTGMVTLQARPSIGTCHVLGPNSIVLGETNTANHHRFYSLSMTRQVLLASVRRGRFESSFLLNFTDHPQLSTMKKLVMVAAVQICFSTYIIQKLLTPEAIISIPTAHCLNCEDNNVISYFSRQLNASGDTPFPNCIMLKIAGTNCDSNKQYCEGIDINSKQRAFTVECSLDDTLESDGKASIMDITGKKLYGMMYMNGELNYPLAVYSKQKKLIGSYVDSTKSFYDGSSKHLFTVEEKEISPAYSERWGASTQYFIEPDIALVTRHHCAIGVCFKNDKVDELTRILVIAFALREYLDRYTSNMLDIPNIKYIYNETDVCASCKV